MASRGAGVFAAALVALVAAWMAAPSLLEVLMAPTYPVHGRGVVVITGASSGIGAHAAETLATMGHTVIAGVRKPKDFDDVVAKGIPTLMPIILDVTNAEHIAAAVERTLAVCEEQGRPLMGVVNNAGVGFRGMAELLDINKAKGMFDINFWGAVAMTKAFLPALRKHKGRVVMINSVAGYIYAPSNNMYTASKAALRTFTNALRAEVGPLGVAVSALHPGWIRTSIVDNSRTFMGASDTRTTGVERYDKLDAGSSEELDRVFAEGSGEAGTVDETTAAIVHALSSPRPRLEYYPGKVFFGPAGVFVAVIRNIPDRVFELVANSR